MRKRRENTSWRLGALALVLVLSFASVAQAADVDLAGETIKIKYLYPSATPNADYRLSKAVGGPVVIEHWDTAKLGAPPGEAELAALDANPEYQAWLVKEQKKPLRKPEAMAALKSYAAIVKKAQDYSFVAAMVANNLPSLTPAEQAFIAKLVHLVALDVRAVHAKEDDLFNADE